MLVIPAIDIQNGKCVRLTKGQLAEKTIYYEDPLDAVKFWEKSGAKRIHIVDLDGAFGIGTNLQLIEKMIKSTKMKIEVGGGIRTVETAEKLINLGVERVVVGTSAVKNPDFVRELSEAIGQNSVIVDLAHKNGKPAISGWTEFIEKDIFEFGETMEQKGAGYILFSSVESDGAFTGPDVQNTKKMVETVNIPVIAAGGIRNKQDILDLRNIGVGGIVVGKAFYENRIKFEDIKNI